VASPSVVDTGYLKFWMSYHTVSRKNPDIWLLEENSHSSPFPYGNDVT
jgi:hypothetical protein